jgi:hypothetical protein
VVGEQVGHAVVGSPHTLMGTRDNALPACPSTELRVNSIVFGHSGPGLLVIVAYKIRVDALTISLSV